MSKFFIKILFPVFCICSAPVFCQTDLEKPGDLKKNWMADNDKGFYNVTTFSVDFFKGPVLNGMQTIGGYRLNLHIAIGAGIGLERYVSMKMYDTLTANLSLMPIFGEIRYTILDKKVTPVVALQGGYKFMINRSSTAVNTWQEDIFPGFAYRIYDEYDYYYEGGFTFTIEAGVKAKVWQRLAVYLSADYSVWTISGEFYHWMYEYLSAPGGQPKETLTYYTLPTMAYNQMLLVRLGIAF